MSFEEAVETYTLYLTKISYLYVHNQQIAEDVVQDVFIKIYRTHKDELPFENPKAYLIKMTMNRCRDYFRSWHYRKVQLTTNWSTREKPHSFSSDREGSLVNAIHKLDQKYREVIILHYYDEQSTKEIASILEIPEGTVKTRLQKARKLLKDYLILEEVESYEEQV